MIPGKALRQRGAVRVSPRCFEQQGDYWCCAVLEEQQHWSSVSDVLNGTLKRCLVGRWIMESGVQKIGTG